MDIPEQRLSPVGLTSLEAFNHQTMAPIQDVISKVQESPKDIASPAGSQPLVFSSGRFDYLTKAEAVMWGIPYTRHKKQMVAGASSHIDSVASAELQTVSD